MLFLFNIPLEIRLAVLFLLGAAAGSLANLGIYRLASQPRPISPWSRLPRKTLPRNTPSRTWLDCIPIFGWLRLRRETRVHGRGFWIRPLMVEVGMALLFALLYWWEVEQWMLLRTNLAPPPVGAALTPLYDMLHPQYFSHLTLLTLMVVASLIDADEKIIPDAITIPGTWLGLLLAAVYPWCLLPHEVWIRQKAPFVEYLSLTTPRPWPAEYCAPHPYGLLIGLGCWWLWCFALLDRRWITRRGWLQACRYFFAHLTRRLHTWKILAMGLVGSLAIGLVWAAAGRESWMGLQTSLFGVACGGGLVWVVRLIGKATLRREAMGFGDVTLLAMIGSFVGWQACLVIFFLAPLAAVVVAGTQWLVNRGREVPYGPFLCLATLAVIVFWAYLWDSAYQFFEVWWLLPTVLGFGAVLMALMLFGLTLLRRMLSRETERD